MLLPITLNQRQNKMFCLSKKNKHFCLFSPLFPDISSAFVICLNVNSFYFLVFLRCGSQKSSAWAEDRKSLPRSSAHACFCASAHLRWNESVFVSTLTLRFPPLSFFPKHFRRTQKAALCCRAVWEEKRTRHILQLCFAATQTLFLSSIYSVDQFVWRFSVVQVSAA